MHSQRSTKFVRLLDLALAALELGTAAILVILGVLALVGLVVKVPGLAHPPFLGSEQLGNLLDNVLAVFVLIELLVTAVAYVRGRAVLHSILEAGIVAIARKLITLDLSAAPLAKAGAVGILLISLALTWWVLARIEVISERHAAPGPSSGDPAPEPSQL